MRVFLCLLLPSAIFTSSVALGQPEKQSLLPKDWATFRAHVNLSTALFLNPLTRHAPIVIRSTEERVIAEIRSDSEIFEAVCRNSVGDMENSDRIEWLRVTGFEEPAVISKELLDQIIEKVRKIPRLPERFRQEPSPDSSALEESLNRIFSSGGDAFRNVEFETSEGTVTLSGEAASEGHRDMAEQIVRELPGVEAVENDIQVVPLTDNAGNEFDWLIRSRIQVAFAMNRYLANEEISVDVEEGVAVLEGQVASELVSSRAASLAAEVVGVNSVENRLEIQ